jgi:hypothetical protein
MQSSTFIAGMTLILTLLTPLTPLPSQAGLVQPPRWVQSDDVRVRAAPSMDGRVIGTLSRGAEVILKAPPDANFCLIGGEGYWGYVACQYLSDKRIARPKAGENGVDAAQRWISGNGVTLRDEPRPNATVVTRMSLNTIVKLLREEGGSGYCEVQSVDGPRGFTACRYLALTPVVIAHIRGLRSADQALSSDYDPERAFWLVPGWEALVEYAEYLKSRHPDIPAEGPWPRNEALERMKAHLALGIKAAKPAPFFDWQTLQNKASQDMNKAQNSASELQRAIGIWGPLHDAISAEGGAARVIRLIRALALPDVKPSLFRSESNIAPPATTAEDASGRFDIVYRQLVTPRPKPKRNADEYSNAGLYDMLARTQLLVRPVQRVQLLRDGRLRVESSLLRQKATLWGDVDEPMCSGWTPGFAFGDADASIWRYFDDEDPAAGHGAANQRESLKINPAGGLFVFYTNIDLPRDTAIRTEILMKLNRNETGFVRGTYLHFDLDGDETPDLAVWEGQGKGPGHLDGITETDDRWYRLAFVNIAGRWKILGSDVFGYGCGC